FARRDQILRVDAKCARDPVEPANGDGPRAHLQPSNSLRGRWRRAAASDVVERQSARAPHLSYPRDHSLAAPNQQTRTVLELSYTLATVASSSRLVDWRAHGTGWATATGGTCRRNRQRVRTRYEGPCPSVGH